LEHIVKTFYDRYIGDYVYTARHEHVAEMVFDRVLTEPERRFDQIVRIMGGMNLDFNSDRIAFGQLVRGHGISDALRSRSLGRAFYDAATKIAPHEAFLLQQRAIFEMEEGGDLSLAETELNKAHSIEPHNKSIQHSLAVLARKQAQATSNPLLRQRLRERARSLLSGHLGADAEHSHGFHTSGQIVLDELRDILVGMGLIEPDQLLERRIVELARDFERFVQEGLQKFPLNEHLLALESDYRQLVHQHGQAESALRKAFNANPRQDWVAIRLARTLDAAGRGQDAKEILIKCLQENPTSKRTHYELALLYMREGDDRDLISDHLRRSFTGGDQNYDAQFWYAREAFLSGKTREASEIFTALRNANMPGQLRNLVRGTVSDSSGRGHVYIGEVASIEDAYMFVKCPDFKENIFVHRTRVHDEEWSQFSRGGRVAFTLGFSMRGPTAVSIRPLN
jgi:tetratricopeptide (TPR) repeat protein/cold shock CspA family protein